MGSLALILFLVIGSGAVQAQQAGEDGPTPTILTVDIERLFAQSQFGLRISNEITQAGAELTLENRTIADTLRAEELALTAARPDMQVEEFLQQAEAFDEKAQAIRREQDAKEAALDAVFATARTQFLDVTRPILEGLMTSRGAVAILDRRSVLLSLGAIDITDMAIARINDALGDGAHMALPEGANAQVEPASE